MDGVNLKWFRVGMSRIGGKPLEPVRLGVYRDFFVLPTLGIYAPPVSRMSKQGSSN